MLADQSLQSTIDKILDGTRDAILEKLESSMSDADSALDDSVASLEDEYDRIISDGHKEAQKVARQITGAADLEARNKQLLLVEGSVDRVFEQATQQVQGTQRDEQYSGLLAALLAEAADTLKTSDFIVHTNAADRSIVQSLLGNHQGAALSDTELDCMGGIKAVTRDGSMTFDNTLDARLERLKPLIRKEIASKFVLGN